MSRQVYAGAAHELAKPVGAPAGLTRKLLGSLPQGTHLKPITGNAPASKLDAPGTHSVEGSCVVQNTCPEAMVPPNLLLVSVTLTKPPAELIKVQLHWMPYTSA